MQLLSELQLQRAVPYLEIFMGFYSTLFLIENKTGGWNSLQRGQSDRSKKAQSVHQFVAFQDGGTTDNHPNSSTRGLVNFSGSLGCIIAYCDPSVLLKVSEICVRTSSSVILMSSIRLLHFFPNIQENIDSYAGPLDREGAKSLPLFGQFGQHPSSGPYIFHCLGPAHPIFDIWFYNVLPVSRIIETFLFFNKIIVFELYFFYTPQRHI